ncbi:fumarate hydratase C-terminal domain-containing protein [Tepidanaerobacter acetatoxydans]|uniref:fumarate hydratase C-terminal domain-containing protein n=1 Tax=Tepidanaerobacter acetatoxydans TaxID=499229 RepID=UPI001BD423DC|nr:fumarate hydratase C-terminal domain-containing protein [Tepidanaerobacter acetatoxydans]
MEKSIRIETPVTDEEIRKLKAGDNVLITGVIYTARDAAHKRLIELIDRGEKLPIDPKGQIIYYVGPAPAKPGYAVGPAGPTTSYRMDPYTPPLLELGLKGMIGKGLRSKEVISAMKEHGAVYFAAVGGAAALIFVVCDSKGIVSRDRTDLNESKQELADISNKQGLSGDISCALKDGDIFIGVSGPGTVTKDMIKTMAKDAIIFALANPVPEIYPDEAKQAGAKVVGTGRSDFPNQINNVLAFPGIFRGALEVRASDINEEMKLAASYAIASLITPEELSPEYCIPGAFDKRVAAHVACEVAKAAMKSQVAKIKIDAEELKKSMMKQ